MMQLNHTYNRNDFLQFLEESFLTDFKKDVRPASTQGLSSIQKAFSLGRSENLDLQVFEFSFAGSSNKRITLTKDAFQIMRSHAIFQALAVFHSPGSNDWRLSLMTATPERTEKGKVALTYSNPKRLSFFLGPNAKVNTPTKFILKRERVIDFEDLKSRFSIEVVNKEFYREISGLFTQLVGGSVQNGKKMENYKALLKLPDVQDHSQTSLEFAVRIIGRVIFCWFLREKKSDLGKSLMPNELLSLRAVKNNPDYYHKILEPIFFEVLNKPFRSRKDGYVKEPFSSIPYLNGGLFSPHDDDFFSYNGSRQTTIHDQVVIPDEWICKFFDVLETYNFTIDENTSFDEELSIDPEMLGRIFENLLAEINPETGESARKNTGSYYTPRAIVDYMIDESLLLYLKTQTRIDGGKLRAAISYDLNDDEGNLLTENERERIITALEKVKILDPACGSGAFPIGALQKIVFILQQTDSDGHLWFKKQIKNTSPELRRVVEREFAHKNFDYIRKLGIIRENIYGVDIQPIATEISRLRCFLTLVVDERIQEDLENRGIEPLPNLDFKFVTANTLISLPGSHTYSQIGLFEDAAGISELKELRDMFFNASGVERDQLKLQFVQAQNRMFQRLISEHRRGHADLTTKLTTWDPFSHKASSWFDPEWMFGIKAGFDVVIANPPYIFTRNQGIDEKQKKYFYENYKHQSNQLNTFGLFIEKGYILLNEQGMLCFITPNNWLTIDTFAPLRKFILQSTSDLKIVNILDRVFAAANVDNAIVLFDKGEPTDLTISEMKDCTEVFSKTIELSSIKPPTYIIQISHLKDSRNQQLLQSIDSCSQPLSTFCTVSTGLKAYQIGKGRPPQTDYEKEHRVFHAMSKRDSTYGRYLEGVDVRRYFQGWSGEYLSYGDWLAEPRRSVPFVGERLLVRQIPAKPPYLVHAIFTDEHYYNDINSMIVFSPVGGVSLKYLLGLINSLLLSVWFRVTFDKLQRNLFPQFKVKELASFPIRPINFTSHSDKTCHDRMVELVEQMLSLHKCLAEARVPHDKIALQQQIAVTNQQIDKLVYELYGLTEEQIKMVERQTNVIVATEPIAGSTASTELTEQPTVS